MFRQLLFVAGSLILIAVAGTGLAGCGGQQVVTKTNSIDGKVMVRVAAGDFLMGTSAQEQSDLAAKYELQPGAFSSESPQETVSLPEFYIDQNAVTNAEYKKFLDANPNQDVPFLADAIAQTLNWDKAQRTFPAGRDQYPVVLVNWNEASAYCKWAGGRLPSEAEWEKAARGADGRTWSWGNEWDTAKANTAESSPQDASPVGQFPKGASPYGALDMVGNVWQWTSSLDKPYPYNANDGREDPQAPGLRVTRGGSWLFGAVVSRVATRNAFEATDASLSIGFRCVNPSP
jgi:formylglycine-generating enzyme required for sulfatase activity